MPASQAKAIFLIFLFSTFAAEGAVCSFSSPGALWLSTNWLMSIPCTSCSSSSGVLSRFKKKATTTKETTVAIAYPPTLTNTLPFGDIMIKAIKDPGDTAATAPPSIIWNQNNAAIPPRIGPKMVTGLISAYGKDTSPIPPIIWMIAAPGADFLAIPLPNTANASTNPAHIPPLASTKYKIDFPVSDACSIARGVKIP